MSRKVAYALLAASCGIAQVQAQNVGSADDSIDEVVVTGYRGAIQSAIA